MTEQELEICRSNYKKLQEEKSKLFAMQKELEVLKETPEVKRYLELKASIDNFRESYSESDMILQAFNETASSTKNVANIYIYLKSYRIFGKTMFLTMRKDITNPLYSPFMYSKYMNIETGHITTVTAFERDNFERDNCVIIPPKTKLDEVDDFTLNAKNLRLWYLEEILNHSQDVAIRKLVMHTDAIKRHFY